MASNPRIHVRISPPNYRTLKQLAIEHGVHMGQLVDQALKLLFTPPEQRPDAAITHRLDLLEDQLDKMDMNSAFQTDLFVEFLTEWLRTRPTENPLSTPGDEARVQKQLERITHRVIERAGETRLH